MTAAARSTRTDAAGTRREAPEARTVRLLAKLPGLNAGALRIERGGEAAAYFFAETPADFGRGFVLEKIDPETCRVCETYHVLLAEDGCSCECKGFLRWGRCKHVPAIGALINAGKIS